MVMHNVTQKNMMTESRHITAKFCKILQQMVSVTKKGRNEVNQSNNNVAA